MNQLELVPSLTKGPCDDCGSLTWRSANLNALGKFHQCSDCHRWNPETKRLERKERPN